MIKKYILFQACGLPALKNINIFYTLGGHNEITLNSYSTKDLILTPEPSYTRQQSCLARPQSFTIGVGYRGNKLIEYKKSLKLTEEQKEILIGCLLGDASMETRKGKPVYGIKFGQSIKNEDYINHLYEIFKPYCGTPPAVRQINKAENAMEKVRYSISFRTFRHSSFIFYYNLFYNPLKCVPKNIHKLLTERGLAYWFMDDGTFNKQINGTKTYLFSTQGFNKTDCNILANVLQTKFKLDCNLQKDKIY
jgi:hypothetical protein